MFCENSALKNFTKFTGKHLCKSLSHRCFPVNFVKFLGIIHKRRPSIREWGGLKGRAGFEQSGCLSVKGFLQGKDIN